MTRVIANQDRLIGFSDFFQAREIGQKGREIKEIERNGGGKKIGEGVKSSGNMHACQGTEQTRAFQAYDGVGAHLRLEDKHRRLCTLVNTRDKVGKATNIRLIKKDEKKEAWK